MLEYSNFVCGGSCWEANWASLDSKGRSVRAHSSSGHPHAAATHSKSSRKASRLSVENIFMSVTCGTVTEDTAGDVLGYSSFWSEH